MVDLILELAQRAGAPSDTKHPYAYLCEVIAERNAMRRQIAILRDGPMGICLDSGMRLDHGEPCGLGEINIGFHLANGDCK